MAKTRKITINPVGFAKSKVKKHKLGGFAKEISEIAVDEKYTEALDGIEDYSHVIIVYLMDKIKGFVTKHRPQGNPRVPVVGIFACRCRARPNHIAISTVKLLKRKGNKIWVKGLDVLDGTPVLDIKPYWPQYDKVTKARVPLWVYELEF